MIGVWLMLVFAHGAPPEVAAATVLVAPAQGVHPAELGAYLWSEHPGARYSGRCSDAGACGPFQITSFWPRKFGFQLPDRDHPWKSAWMAAGIAAYSQRSHRRNCRGRPHGWIAHMYAARSARDSPYILRRVRHWKALRRRLLVTAF